MEPEANKSLALVKFFQPLKKFFSFFVSSSENPLVITSWGSIMGCRMYAVSENDLRVFTFFLPSETPLISDRFWVSNRFRRGPPFPVLTGTCCDYL